MGLGVVGRPGPFLSPCPCRACFSPSHSHPERTLAIGDATTLMGGQVSGGVGGWRGRASMGRGSFLLGSEAGREFLGFRKAVSAIIQKRANTVSGVKYANS